jgi:hypothetical protein
VLRKGDIITIDGSKGEVIDGTVDMVQATSDPDFQTVSHHPEVSPSPERGIMVVCTELSGGRSSWCLCPCPTGPRSPLIPSRTSG